MAGNDGCAVWSYGKCMRRAMFAHLVECYVRSTSDDGGEGFMHMALSVVAMRYVMAN